MKNIIKPSLLGLKVEINDFQYSSAADFLGEEIDLEINFHPLAISICFKFLVEEVSQLKMQKIIKLPRRSLY